MATPIPPPFHVRLGTPEDPGSVHGLVLAGTVLLATHYGASGRGKLHVLDPRTLAPVADPMPVGHYPRAVAWHPGRRTAYVMNWGKESYSVSACALDTGRVEEIPIGFGLIAVAVDPAADVLYTADWAHRRLFAIEAGDPARRRIIALPSRPVRLAVAPDGRVHVSLSDQAATPPVDALAVVESDGTVRAAPVTPSRLQPGPVAVGQDGLIYLASLGGGSVHPLAGVHAPDTGERLGAVGTAAGSRDLAAHPHLSQAWAATDRGAQFIDATGPYQPHTLEPVVTGPSPYGVAVGADGGVYVGDNVEGTVSLIRPDLTELPLAAVSTLLTDAGYPVAGGLGGALRAYQEFHELPVTGRPDATTVAHLTAPGCGTPDPVAAVPSFHVLNHYRHTNLTYHLGDMHMPNARPGFTDELKEELVRVAFAEWNKVLGADWYGPFDFERVDDPAQADILISVGDDPVFHESNWFRSVYAVTKWYAGQNWPAERAQLPMIFNREINWDAPGYFEITWYNPDFRHVVTHELGHALGLHHGKSKNVMYRNATWYRVPKSDDRAGIHHAYGRLPFLSGTGMQVLPGVDHIALQDCEQHLLVHYPADADTWTYTRLTADLGAPLMARGHAPSLFFAHDGVPSYVYRGAGDHLHQLWYDGGEWWWNDLNVETGGAPPIAGSPYAYRNGDTQRIVYGDPDGRIIRLSETPGAGWTWQDISQSGAGTHNGSIIGYVDQATGLDAVAYRDNEDGLRLLQEHADGWSHISLTWATQAENPTPLEAMPIFGSARAGEAHRLFAVDYRLDIRMWEPGGDGVWHTRSLTAELGLPPTRAMTVQRLFSVDEVDLTWVIVCSDHQGGLREIVSDGDAWQVRDIPTGDLPPGRTGISAWVGDTRRYLTYTAVNGNTALLSRPSSDVVAGEWQAHNLTRESGII
ncbi:matrixin family metalloprotease [Micromonospora sp. NBC_01392]|uniref:matrixin family metalloprotease n=1 Tax=Micromonospora sp. NBC_01392 TaxID=2903588 RepID=UPI0032507409